MQFSNLSNYFQQLEQNSSRLKITDILSEVMTKSDKNEIDKVVYLSLGVLAPNYKGLVLNLAEKMMIKVISDSYGQSEEKVKQNYRQIGDLGDLTYKYASSSFAGKQKHLSVSEVYDLLIKIVQASGNGSQEMKVGLMKELLLATDPLSAKYLSRIPLGKLRLGFSEKTIIDSLSKSFGYDVSMIEEAYNVFPDIGFIAKSAMLGQLEGIKPTIGVPVVPMLAQRLNSTQEMIKKMGQVSVEPKFDGLRIFIHFKKPDYVRVFTRNMNYLDESIFPELQSISQQLDVQNVILDTEAVGLDIEREGFVDFQKTIQRRRKHEVEKSSKSTPLQFQVFDLILLNNQSLIKTPYLERRKVLEKIIKKGSILKLDEYTLTKDAGVIKSLHKKYLDMGLEGVIVKCADSFYVSGRTGWNWVKMKEEEGKKGKIVDTIDAVIMGYSQGKGKRSGFGVGQFLAGVVSGSEIVTLTKVGTGITDENFKKLETILSKIKLSSQPLNYKVHKDLLPDYWVEPKIVVELAADEITASPKHTSGFALRFPRLIKFRQDKAVSEATTLNEIKEMV